MAAALAQSFFETHKLGHLYYAESRGITEDYEPENSPAAPQGVSVMKEHYGLDTTSHRSRMLTSADMQSAHLIICMTFGHVRAVSSMFRGPSFDAKLMPMPVEISDPWHSPVEVYRGCADQIAGGLQGLLTQLFLADSPPAAAAAADPAADPAAADPAAADPAATTGGTNKGEGGGGRRGISSLFFLLALLIVLYTTSAAAAAADNNKCNIEVRPVARGAVLEFPRDRPIVYKVLNSDGGTTTRHDELLRVGSESNLREEWGDSVVKLSSSNAYSHYLREVSLSGYLDYMSSVMVVGDDDQECSSSTSESEEDNAGTPPASSGRAANETWYLFGNNESRSPFKDLSQLYHADMPAVTYSPEDGGDDTAPAAPALQEPTVVIGLGTVGSGLSFHFHGPGLSEALQGRKRWFLYHPSKQPRGGFERLANTTLAEWVGSTDFGSCTDFSSPSSLSSTTDEGANMDNDVVAGEGGINCFYECTIGRDELIYFPANWYHATLNEDPYTLFASVFL
jgi:protein-tyrosine phosphatase